VNAVRALSISLAVAMLMALGGCLGTRHAPPPAPVTGGSIPPPAPQRVLPPAPETVPDAVPRYEPRSAYGNPPFYDVFGKRYFVLSSSADYVERGVASWYGPGFHKVRTSTGEPYDMYGMSAAHKTLPLPCYARITNLQNGRSIVVRVNDRGPFVGNRIIDLSYSAAAKLDMLRNGTAMVEVRTVGPTSPPPVQSPPVLAARTQGATPWVSAASPLPTGAPAGPGAPVSPPVPAPAPAPVPSPPSGALPIAPAPVTSAPVSALFVQAGAFADPANAERLAQKLRGAGYGAVFVRDDVIAGRRMYRVRIGPVPDVPHFDRIVAALEQVGVRDAHLALD
jgi:rare lipoprotein A